MDMDTDDGIALEQIFHTEHHHLSKLVSKRLIDKTLHNQHSNHLPPWSNVDHQRPPDHGTYWYCISTKFRYIKSQIPYPPSPTVRSQKETTKAATLASTPCEEVLSI